MNIADYNTQSHAKWYCRYRIVFTPKYRKKVLFEQKRKRIGEILRELAKQKEGEVIEGHSM